MREDLRELLEKHFPNGYILMGICANNAMDIEHKNDKHIPGLDLIHEISVSLLEDPDAWSWIDQTPPEEPFKH